MRNHWIFVLLFSALNQLYSQFEQNPALIKKLNINRSECYVDSAFYISEPKLVKIDTYNKEGNRVSIDSGNYKSTINRTEYSYHNDKILFEIRHYKNNKLAAKRKVICDNKGLELKSIELDSTGNETAKIIVKGYNKKNQLVSEQHYNKDTLKEYISYRYSKDGQISKKRYNRTAGKSKEVLYYKYGEKPQQPIKKEKSFLEYYHGLWISTFDHEKDARLFAEVFYNQDGLIDSIYFYKNRVFYSRLIYKYFTF